VPVNIYSHLIGGFLFATLPFVVYLGDQKRSALAQLSDLAVFSTFFFGVATCFFLSAT
jgi:adiponectin receptor